MAVLISNYSSTSASQFNLCLAKTWLQQGFLHLSCNCHMHYSANATCFHILAENYSGIIACSWETAPASKRSTGWTSLTLASSAVVIAFISQYTSNILLSFCLKEKKKTLSFYASIMPTFSLWKEQLSSHLRCFCDRKYLAQGFTVWSLNFSYLKFCNVNNVSKTQPQFNFPLPLRSWKFTSNRTFSPTCSNQSSRRTFLRDFS